MKMKQKFIVVFMALVITLGLSTSVFAAGDSDIEAFVTRFNVQILDRQPDGQGLAEWSDNLRTGTEAGANVGYGFIQSEEFKKRNLGDEEYIRVLYRAFFDREADADGLNAWLGVLDSGLSRLHVYKGFAESVEFTELCSRYGISRGSVTLTAPMDQNENVTKFVVRCYRLCLGRNADNDGLNGWCSQIISGANSAKEAAHGFVFSNEFKNKNLSNSEYVKVLYRVFMDREADNDGQNAWVSVLENGKSREHVFNGFSDSVEFHKLCEQYGIYAGEPSLEEPTPEEPTPAPNPEENWKALYVKKYQETMGGIPAGLGEFSLYDVDNDGIPELFTAIYGGNSTAAIRTMYTVSDGKVKTVFDWEGWPAEFYVGERIYMTVGAAGNTSEYSELYQYASGNVKLLASKDCYNRDQNGGFVNSTFKVGDSDVTEQQYDEYVNAAIGNLKEKPYDTFIIEDGISLTESNIDQYVTK